MTKELDPSRQNEQTDRTTEKACAEDATAHKLEVAKLRLMVITMRRALVAALKLCDQLAEQLKTK